MVIHAEIPEAHCRFILMEHALRLLPHIQMFFPDGKKNGDVLLPHNMALPEDGILDHSGDNLCQIVAEHMSDRVLRSDKFHYALLL